VFDYRPFPVLTHTMGMTHFQNARTDVKYYKKQKFVTLHIVMLVTDRQRERDMFYLATLSATKIT